MDADADGLLGTAGIIEFGDPAWVEDCCDLSAHTGLRRLAAQWEGKAATGDHVPGHAETRQVMLELLESQRQHLRELNRDPAIDDDLLRHEVYLIDLEEERLRMKM
ncbi:MAG: hypothetical protein JST41_10600 [Bacteroidetes bacterium]|jgi:CPA1 family monovalent cation:H+ antiporter|nr:hypothetical protein [Bacteroidota bacterium]MBX7130723.1 hypothetical protein [Flavobacteriales bacterium]HMU15183.1 hypothetical protein [Flavobacteriales bacterium]HMW96952.1 hypothetical protein [Flavobacteriales bacterium]HMZ49009.1 hypothetical protein [Flavobacteriales bacterium]